jgi:hypothetical protein
MTRDEMIALAKEAGWEYATDDRGFEPVWCFAALVVQAEREACAKVCEDKNTLLAWPTCAAAIRARGEK